MPAAQTLSTLAGSRQSAASLPAAQPRSRRASIHRRIAACRPVAAAAPTDSPPPPAAAARGGLLALKEWAPTVAAIADGEQTVLLRKGGIREPNFRPQAREFLLFPTSFHTDAQLLKPDAAQRYAAECSFDPKAQQQLVFATRAEVTGCWTTADPSVLELLDGLHVWAPGFLEARLKWRGSQPLTVLELRAWRLPEPVVVAPQPDFFGCFSWVDLAASPDGVGEGQQQPAAAVAAALAAAAAKGMPALDDAAFAERQALCRRQLAKLGDLQELAV